MNYYTRLKVTPTPQESASASPARLAASRPGSRERVFVMQPAPEPLLPSGLSGFDPRHLPPGYGGGYGYWQGPGGQQMGSLLLRGGRGGISGGVGLGLMI
jgi:hypothetical protein